MPVNDRIQLRRGTEDQWIAAEAADADDEPLADGEPGVVVDADGVPLYLVVGDTGTEFEDLPRFSPDSALSATFERRPSAEPGPVDQVNVWNGSAPEWAQRVPYGPLSMLSFGLPTPGRYADSLTPDAGRMVWSGLPVTTRRQRARLGIEVTTASAGATAMLGLYRLTDPFGDSFAMTLVKDFGLVGLDAVGVVEAVTAPFTPTPGLYAVGFLPVDLGSGSPAVRRLESPGRMWEVRHHAAVGINRYAPYLDVTAPFSLPTTVTSNGMSITANGAPYAWLR